MTNPAANQQQSLLAGRNPYKKRPLSQAGHSLPAGQESILRCSEWEILRKHHAEAGRYDFYQVYFHPSALPMHFSGSWGWWCLVGRSRRCLLGGIAPHLEVATAHGQAQNQRAGKFGRVTRARKPAPSAWRWVRASAPYSTESHGQTSCCLQPATVVPRGRGDVRLYWSGPPTRFSQVGGSSPQPWVQTSLSLLSHSRKSTGACPVTFSGLWGKSRMAPLQAPRWTTPAYQQGSVLTRTPFLFQVTVKRVPSWPRCGRPALAIWRPK